MSTLASSLGGLSREPAPAARATAPRARAACLRRAATAPRTRGGGLGRSTLVASAALHLLLAGALWTLGSPTRATPPPRAPQAAFVLPETLDAAAEPQAPHDEPAVHELPPVPVAAACPEAELCESVPAPAELPAGLTAGPALTPLDAGAGLPALSAARRLRARTVAPAPAPAVPSPTPVTTAVPSAPVAAARAPDLPLDATLARLPRGLVVQLLLTVEGDGRVSRVQVEVPSSSAHFDLAAQAWVAAHWRFAASGQRFRTRVPFRLAAG